MMLYKYILLKSNWGIVIFIELEQLLNPQILNTDILICDKMYLRLGIELRFIKQSNIEFWLSNGIKDLKELIYPILKDSIVCYNIKLLDFNYAHFQEEGLYYAIQELLAKHYNIVIPPNDIYFDKDKNMYIFPHLRRRG
jgi:hypothetical protein